MRYMAEASKEFSFTGFSSYFALVRRTFQLMGHDEPQLLVDLSEEDRIELLGEPSGLLTREVAGLLPEAKEVVCAWRFVRRDWTFSKQFRSEIGVVIDPENPMNGPLLQKHLARVCGVRIPLDARKVPLEFRRER